MRCLWLTLADPEPRHNGQFVYSGGLIDAVTAAGAKVDVVGLARPGKPQQLGIQHDGANWWLAEHRIRPRWSSLLSNLPNIAARGKTRELEELVRQRLSSQQWDAVVFDGISAGWALPQVLSHLRDTAPRPKLIYISHNHEQSLRLAIAKSHPHPLKRSILQIDAWKVARLENALVDAVDYMTAITPEDRELYTSRKPAAKIGVLTPGYDGRDSGRREINAKLPRRAIIVGSFDWIAKRMNLEEFVAVADPLFARHGAELQVIGSAEPEFLNHLRKKVKATTFTGTVEAIDRFMEDARVALVPEKHGGGFKLKVLDYVFNRMPILALDGSVAGVPLKDGDSILLYPDHDSLARGVLGVIDDVDRLNTLQESAYSTCRDRFNWESRGTQLVSMMAASP